MKPVIAFLVVLATFSAATAQNRRDSLLVFVGEKIDVAYSPEKEEEEPIQKVEKAVVGENSVLRPGPVKLPRGKPIRFDGRYVARYKILQSVYGGYTNDTIEFVAFDHYGMPKFSQFKHVLLFVSYYQGKLYHEKYQYFDVYLTDDNKWASPYPSADYNHPYKDSITVKPEKIRFRYDLSFPLDGSTSDALSRNYSQPFYALKDGRAIPLYGNYIDDLFKLKQQTVLKARGVW